MIYKLVSIAYKILSIAIVVRCIVSWIPGFNIYSEPARILYKLTDWILEPIQNILDRFGLMTFIDISPIIALFLLRTGYTLILKILFM